MNQLGNGLHYAQRHTESLVVREAELAMLRRLGAPKEHILDTQSNLAGIYLNVGRDEEASRVLRDVYAGRLKLDGEEAFQTLVAASNYANSLDGIERFEEAKPLLRKTIPVARRTLGESHDLTLRMTWNYARTLCEDTGATLVDLREAVTTLEDSERIARRVLGGAHPTTEGLQISLRKARAVLRARETPPGTTR